MSPIKRQNRISGQFSPRLVEMLESPAYRALSRSAHMVISPIEIEPGRHGGNDNGRLPVTVEQFVEYGLHHRGSVAPAIREAEALGFIRVTERGRGGNAEHRSPNKFLLTFGRGIDSRKYPPSDDWRHIKTVEEAKQIARAARADKDAHAIAHGRQSWHKRRNASDFSTRTEKASNRKQKTDTGFCTVSTPETGTEHMKIAVPETGTTGPVQKPVLPLYLGKGERSAPAGSAVASEPNRDTAIDMIMRTRGCSRHEAVEMLDSIPNAPPGSSECPAPGATVERAGSRWPAAAR